MNYYEIIELSKIYKRVLAVESALKTRLFIALTDTYKNPFNRLIPYLKNIIPHEKYKSGSGICKRDRITDLLLSNKSQSDKLTYFLSMAYLLDTLKILTDYKPIFKDKDFCRHFYKNKPTQNIIKKNAANLNKLRNAVMHFDYTQYEQNKTIFLEALNFWERLLYCQNCFMHTLPTVKPKTMTLLSLLAKNFPNFFETNDRIICDMFDDLAFINGLPIEKLPTYWSIGRAIYHLKAKMKNKK